jgi:hypothetical protein
MADKVTPRLAERLSTGPDDVEVIVELRPLDRPDGGTRQERVAALRDSFAAELGPVAEQITAAGGEVLESAWINQTLRVRLPAAAVDEVAASATVIRIDLPTTLEAG